MYIYSIPYEINRELCRILDNVDDWKELADRMGYKAFEINEIEQIARRNSMSPTNQLFTTWGQQNHKVGELFIALYRMEHIPALRCLVPIVDDKFHTLYKKLCPEGIRERNTSVIEDKANKKQKIHSEESSIPLPVKLIEQGVLLPTSSKGLNGTPTDDESADLSTSSQESRENDIRAEIRRNVAAIPMLPYDELKEATNNWNASNMLGQGGFAQVFKGEWKQLTVAVKRLRAVDARDRELIRELCLNQYRHDNIVPLYGYSYGGAEVCLVYQLMCGGTLDQRLRRKMNIAPLTWSQRHRIAHGVARGLQFLHTMSGTPLIHGDIKPANILLDQCLIPKIGDFGLARKGPYGDNRSHVKVSRVHGTRPYLPDEYIRSGCLSPAVDVFSYGVVMLEIATCLKPIDNTRSIQRLTDFMRIETDRAMDTAIYEDPALQGTPNSNPQVCRDFIDIGIHCTKYARHERPNMLEVYKKLNGMIVPGKPAMQ
ncbi:unnamed protein product [Chilo suppressalis]|uniref:non-specific serine/threonine protein kinase n=1 Tax=Chilo suppressalis TaxID=168631 RepID=A0ABN8AYV3_CHISP|nr:unnamed protein product [Chilo suppressalis]